MLFLNITGNNTRSITLYNLFFIIRKEAFLKIVLRRNEGGGFFIFCVIVGVSDLFF
jgi:hypothetical protein